jgi:protein-S-isoprenylcysteine O-methyltransferase Ste14
LIGAYLFHWILLFWTALAVIVCISLFFVNAPYGRYARRGWGRKIDPKWGWFIMEAPSLLLPLLFFFFSARPQDITAFLFLFMWEVHYVQRVLIFPFVMKKGPYRMPLLVMFLALFFNIINSYLNSGFLFTLAEPYGMDWLLDGRFICGAILFFSGFLINIHSDSILRGLRGPGESAYKIPHKGLFRYISSPNYFGEIVEWTGWAVATWSLPGAAFALWTVANLAPRALANHKWYKKTFPEYPSRRKALIPFLL